MILTNKLKGIPTEVLKDTIAGESYALLRLGMLSVSSLGGNTPKEAAWNELFRRYLNYLCGIEIAEMQQKKVQQERP